MDDSNIRVKVSTTASLKEISKLELEVISIHRPEVREIMSYKFSKEFSFATEPAIRYRAW